MVTFVGGEIGHRGTGEEQSVARGISKPCWLSYGWRHSVLTGEASSGLLPVGCPEYFHAALSVHASLSSMLLSGTKGGWSGLHLPLWERRLVLLTSVFGMMSL